MRGKVGCALGVSMLLAMGLGGCAGPGEEDDNTVAAVLAEDALPAPALSVQSVIIGATESDDGAVSPQLMLRTVDPILVAVSIDGVADDVPIAVRLTYQDGQVAGEQVQEVTGEGEATRLFRFTSANPWPAGKYNVHVTVNGRTVGLAQQLEIR